MEIDDRLRQDFQNIIAGRTGLRTREEDWRTLSSIILARVKYLKFREPGQYLDLLSGATGASTQEWKQLTALVTTGETYFFRDKEQFSLLQNRILPELIERKWSQRLLRLWCAGCSNGEEPYSIAMLVDMVLPAREEWNILILGTDINAEAIMRAKRGLYAPWSFRTMDPAIKERYFRNVRDEWEIDRKIREMVKFETNNLKLDEFPNPLSAIHNIDLIICRNVFIYFDEGSIALVTEKFTDTLNENGYLMTGHGELHAQNLSARLKMLSFPESVIYRKGAAMEVRGLDIGVLPQQPYVPKKSKPALSGLKKTSPEQEKKVLDRRAPYPEMEKLLHTGNFAAVAAMAKTSIGDDPDNFTAHYLAAQAYANLGNYDLADENCRKAIKIRSTDEKPYFLLAQIAEDQGDSEKAKDLLKTALYLDPKFIAAYVELGALYGKEGDAVRAVKMQTSAWELLKALPTDMAIEPYKETTAGELLQHLKKTMENGGR